MQDNGYSVEGEPVFQGVMVDLEGMGCLNVLWVLEGDSEVISINTDLWYVQVQVVVSHELIG